VFSILLFEEYSFPLRIGPYHYQDIRLKSPDFLFLLSSISPTALRRRFCQCGTVALSSLSTASLSAEPLPAPGINPQRLHTGQR
jgi:hypothetical protein